MHVSATKKTAISFILASLAVASIYTTTPAGAQYMVIDGVGLTGSNSAIASEQFNNGRSIFVQDYNSYNGVKGLGEEKDEMASTAILNGMFDGYIDIFGALIGVPAILIAVLRLFVRKQTAGGKTKKRSFELPAAPAASRIYRPVPARNY